MTTPDHTLAARLAPCPFCGGEAKRHTLPSDDFGNEGGDVIECVQCLASSCVEFGRKENLVSAWNTRTNQLITTAEADARVGAAVLAEREAAVILVYEIIYENGHVTLGDKLVAAIRSRGVTG